MFVLSFFILIATIVSYIDIKKGYILDKIVFPAFAVLMLLKYLDASLVMEDFIGIVIVLFIFAIPIAFNMAFGGGDLRFGALSALFVGLEGIGYFVLYSALLHLMLLFLLEKKSFPFAPSMSLGALGAYVFVNFI